jgi:hypothetical protein
MEEVNMKELTFDEISKVSGAGRATGTRGSQVPASCSDGVFWGVLGGGIAGAGGGLFGIALGMMGGFLGGGGAGGCFKPVNAR